MPQDPHLYGQRPAKKQKKEIPLSSSLTFASQLSSLLSSSTATAASPSAAPASTSASASSGRPRPSKRKDDLFSVRAKKKRKNDDDNNNGGREESGKGDNSSSRSLLKKLKTPHGTEDERQAFLRARRNMEEKARRYAAMKRGDYIAPSGPGGGGGGNSENDPLIDFDRKWAERHPEGDGNGSSSVSDNESDDDDDDDDEGDNPMNELVEYKDEFGRTRTGTRAEALRQARRDRRRQLGAEELEAMAARPLHHHHHQDTEHENGSGGNSMSNIIHGDVIQSAAFLEHQQASGADARRAMADLAARRDRSPTPPADAHFDGRAEIRSKGVGFYQFATDDGAARQRQMEGLRRAREDTERERAARAAEREGRRREIEERRARVGRARAEKMAGSFLDGLAGELGLGLGVGSGSGGGTGGEGVGTGVEGDDDTTAAAVPIATVTGESTAKAAGENDNENVQGCGPVLQGTTPSSPSS
ncbi:hypothetical protein SLS62_004466 [Diatrype stigma]|uniref:Uncharacterized protein n=1 Tax=Diatrype stigma TaxID=117547 RepID=A0AAN9V502_9PEZI